MTYVDHIASEGRKDLGGDRFDEREELLDEPPLGYGDDFEDGHLDSDE